MIHYLPSSSPFSGASSCPSGSGECIPGDNCSCRTKYSSFHWMTTTFGCSLPSCFRSSICGESFRNWSYRCSSAGPSFRLESKHSYVFFYHIRPEIPVFSLHSPAIQLDDSTVGAGACFFFSEFPNHSSFFIAASLLILSGRLTLTSIRKDKYSREPGTKLIKNLLFLPLYLFSAGFQTKFNCGKKDLTCNAEVKSLILSKLPWHSKMSKIHINFKIAHSLTFLWNFNGFRYNY